jgi:ABC-2 type transport system permease protein
MFLHELRFNRKTTAIWAGSITALIVFYMAIFPAFSKDASMFQKMLDNYPEPIRNAFGSSISSIGTILGFYSFVFVFVLLIGAIQAMNLGTSILSKESRERTADFLLTKPVSRLRIMTSKLMAAFTLLLATNVICYAAAAIMANIVKTNDYNRLIFFMISATLFFVQIIFFVLGVIISVFFQRLKSVLPISLGTVFAFFFIGMLIATDKDDPARFITPFKYFDTSYIIKNSSYEVPYLLAASAFIIAAVAASYIIYSKKDIHAV